MTEKAKVRGKAKEEERENPPDEGSKGEEAPADHRSTAREYYEAILIAVIFALFVRTFVIQAFKIPSGSMEDNLLVGDHILVDKVTWSPRLGQVWDRILPYREVARGDVVVFKWPRDPQRDFIKRCVAVPGDVVEIRDKVVYINGVARKEDPKVYFREPDVVIPDSPRIDEDHRYRDNMPARTVPADSFFMMGDNRDRSYDSRVWGFVPADNVKGRALLIYWSFDSPPQGTSELSAREKIRQLFDVAIHFFTKTRWSRTLNLIR